jgi:hypothetical protein
MKTILPLIIIGLFYLSGCKSYYLNKYCKPVTSRSDSSVSARISTFNEVEKDSKIYIPAVQTTFYIPSPCDSLGKLKQGVYSNSQGNSKAQVILSDTGIIFQANCDKVISHWRSMYRQSYDSLSYYREVNQTTVVEKQLSWFQHFRLNNGYFWWIGFIGISGIFIYSFYRLFRVFK